MKKLLLMVIILGLCIPVYATPSYESGQSDAKPVVIYGKTGGVIQAVNTDSSGNVGQGATAESTTPTEATDGAIGTPWYDTFWRQVIAGYNNAVGALDASIIAPIPVDSGAQQILSVTFDADPDDDNPQTSTVVFIGNARSVGFSLSTVIDRTAETVQVDYTVEISPDNSTWFDCDTIMTDDGEDAPQATINHQSASDTTIEETVYLPKGFTAQYVKVVADVTDSDADDTAVVSVYIYTQN